MFYRPNVRPPCLLHLESSEHKIRGDGESKPPTFKCFFMNCNPFWYGEGLDGGYFVTILIDMKFKESMYYLSSCVVMAKLYFAFFQSKTSPKWGSSQQNLIKRCSLSFQNLDWIVHWIYHLLVMIPLLLHLDWTLFKWKMVFKKEFEVTKS